MTQKQRRIYRKACALLARSTPLRADCGVLCGRACCRGDDETGMLLFPGEATTLAVKAKNGRRVAVCGGRCKRALRPLSCRVFPFVPLPQTNGKIAVLPDGRGYGICPLVRHAEEAAFSHRFLHRVKRAGALLCRDKACRAFLQEIGREAAACESLRAQLFEK